MRSQTLTIRLDDMYSIEALTNTQADFFEGWKKKDIQDITAYENPTKSKEIG